MLRAPCLDYHIVQRIEQHTPWGLIRLYPIEGVGGFRTRGLRGGGDAPCWLAGRFDGLVPATFDAELLRRHRFTYGEWIENHAKAAPSRMIREGAAFSCSGRAQADLCSITSCRRR